MLGRTDRIMALKSLIVFVDPSPGGAARTRYAVRLASHDGSDLIVLGAYSHARSREFIFGGVTRTMLRNITMPTLIAH
jgi:nucleotide-binding universal stress UspA family protein